MSLDGFKNFAVATLAATLPDASTTTFTVASGHGLLLPTVPFNAVAWNATDYASPDLDPTREIVRVTVIATDTLTVTRAQEGTTGATHNTGGKTYKLLATVTAKTLTTDLPRPLASNIGQSGITSATFVSMMNGGGTLTIPAATLAAGDLLRIDANYSHIGGTTISTFYEVLFDGVTILGGVGDAATSTSYALRVDIAIITSTTQRAAFRASRGDGLITCGRADLTSNVAGALVLNLQARLNSSAAESVALDHYLVTLHKVS